MESDIKTKMDGGTIQEKTQQQRDEDIAKRAKRSAELEFELRAKLADGLNAKDTSSSESDDGSSEKGDEKQKKKGKVDKEADLTESRRRMEDYDYSSGVESDNDVDLLVE